MKKLILSNLFLLICFNLYAQTEAWKKCYGGSDEEYGLSTIIGMNGNYLTAGKSNSLDGDVTPGQGGDDVWIFETDTSGGIVTERSFGGTLDDGCNHLLQLGTGEYGLAGFTYSNDGNVSGNHGAMDAWGLVLDGGLNMLGGLCYGGTGDEAFEWSSEIPGNGFLLCGFTDSPNDGDVNGLHGGKDIWVVKVDALGTLDWQKCLGGSLDDIGRCCISTSDGNFLIAGYTSSNDGDLNSNYGGNDYWLVKLAPSGNIIWQKNYGGSGDDQCREVIETDDGNYVLTGTTNSTDHDVTFNNGYNDTWVIKVDNNNGNLIWANSFGGSLVDYSFAIAENSNGSLFLGGHSASSDGNVSGNNGIVDFWLLALDHSGNYLWNETWGGTSPDFSMSIAITPDDEILITGTSSSNDSDVTNNHGNEDIWIVKTNMITTKISSIIQMNELHIFPNPATSEFSIIANGPIQSLTVTVYSRYGEEMYSSETNKNRQTIICGSFPPGIYLVKAGNEEMHWFRKLLVQ